MKLRILTRNFPSSDALRNYIEDKMQRLTHWEKHIPELRVSLHLENITHVAEADIEFDHVEINANAKAEDMYAAIDLVMDKLIAQITKHKEKVIDGHR